MEKLRAENISGRERYATLESENARLADTISQQIAARDDLEKRVAQGKELLEHLRIEREGKELKVEELKKRLQLIAERKENYYERYEKHLLNQYLEYKGNIRVFVRVRPFLSQDFKAYGGTQESFEQVQKAISVLNSN